MTLSYFSLVSLLMLEIRHFLTGKKSLQRMNIVGELILYIYA